MSAYLEKARQLRARTDVHCNCCQAVLIPFAEKLGLTEAQAYAIGNNFGGGMLHGSVCGTLSGALMVLGGLGIDRPAAQALIRRFKEEHGATDCAALLKASHDRGEGKKQHCDGLVYEMVEAVAGILEDSGKRNA